MQSITQSREEYIRSLGIAPGPSHMKGIYADPNYSGISYPDGGTPSNTYVPAGWPRRVIPLQDKDPNGPPGAPIQYYPPMSNETAEPGFAYEGAGQIEESGRYFYHGDHLGSTSYVTDARGRVSQYVAYMPYGEALFEEHSSTRDMPYLFNAKERDEETGLYYYGARYLDPETAVWYGVDPLAMKYPDMGGYVYCMGNPIKYIDPTGMDWYEFQDNDGAKAMWRKSQDKTYTDNNGNTWNNIGENYLSINGDKATLFTQHTNDKGELYLKNSSYNLANRESTNSLTSTMGDMLSKGSAIAASLGGLAKGSNASFRLTNSKGKLDFKFYGNGWKGNQYVTPTAMSNLGKVVQRVGKVAGFASIAVYGAQFFQGTSMEGRMEHGLDAFMGGLGYVPGAGTAISLFWSFGGKELHWNHVNNHVMPAIQMDLPPHSYLPFK